MVKRPVAITLRSASRTSLQLVKLSLPRTCSLWLRMPCTWVRTIGLMSSCTITGRARRGCVHHRPEPETFVRGIFIPWTHYRGFWVPIFVRRSYARIPSVTRFRGYARIPSCPPSRKRVFLRPHPFYYPCARIPSSFAPCRKKIENIWFCLSSCLRATGLGFQARTRASLLFARSARIPSLRGAFSYARIPSFRAYARIPSSRGPFSLRSHPFSSCRFRSTSFCGPETSAGNSFCRTRLEPLSAGRGRHEVDYRGLVGSLEQARANVPRP